MKPSKFLFLAPSKTLGVMLLACLGTTATLSAATGTWSSVATTGNWSDTANWTGGTVGSGATSTATFGTNITVATTVTQDIVGLQIGNLTFSDNGASDMAWTVSGANSITLGDGVSTATSTLTALTPITLSPQLTGLNSLVKAGAAAAILTTRTNSYSGGTTVNTGELQASIGVPAAGAMTTFGSGAITVNTGTTLRFKAGSTSNAYSYANAINLNTATLAYEDGLHTLTGNVALTGANTFTGVWAGKTLTLPGVVSGAGSLTHAGSSTMTLSGANTFSGTTSVTGGILRLDYATNNNSKLSDTVGVTLGSGGTLRLLGNPAAASSELVNGLTLSGGGTTLGLDTAAGQTLTADFTGSGAGTLTGGQFTLNVATTGTGTAQVKLPGTTANTSVLPGVIYNSTFAGTDANNYLKSTTALNNTSTDLGTWASGATQYSTTGSAFTGAVGSITIEGITFNDAAARTVAIGAGNTVTVNQGIIVTPTVGNFVSTISGGSIQGPAAGPLVVNNNDLSNSLTIASVIANNGVGSVLKTGSGLLVLSGANTFAGGLTIELGRVNAPAAGVLGTGPVTAGVNTSYGAAYASAGTPFLAVTATGNQVVSNNIVLPAAPSLRYYAIQKSDVTSSLELSGTISGGGPNTVFQLDTPTAGDSTTLFILSGNNTLSGQVRLNRGSVTLTNANALGTATLFTQSNVNAANGNIRFTNSFTLPNNITIGTTNNQTFNTNANDVVLSGVFSGVGSWSKIGTGTLTLTGVNTLAGATNVNAGTVAGSGSATSALNVAATATLSPGVGIGTWLSSTATFASGSTFKAEINSTTATADKLKATGAVNLGGATLTLSDLGSAILSNGTKLTLIDYTGGSLTGTFASLAEGATVTLGSNTFLLSYADASKVTLTAQLTGGYNTWAIDNAGSQEADLDFDEDGVKNGVEYFMGQTGSSFTPNPAAVAGQITWPKDASAIATYVVETSTNLTSWSPALTGVNDTGTSVIFTLPTGASKVFVRLHVSAP